VLDRTASRSPLKRWRNLGGFGEARAVGAGFKAGVIRLWPSHGAHLSLVVSHDNLGGVLAGSDVVGVEVARLGGRGPKASFGGDKRALVGCEAVVTRALSVVGSEREQSLADRLGESLASEDILDSLGVTRPDGGVKLAGSGANSGFGRRELVEITVVADGFGLGALGDHSAAVARTPSAVDGSRLAERAFTDGVLGVLPVLLLDG